MKGFKTLQSSLKLICFQGMEAREDCFTQFSSFNSLTDWVMGEDDSAEIFLSFLQEALVSGFGIGRDVHSLTLSIQHFFCQPVSKMS